MHVLEKHMLLLLLLLLLAKLACEPMSGALQCHLALHPAAVLSKETGSHNMVPGSYFEPLA
jgi:hypothetical protein